MGTTHHSRRAGIGALVLLVRRAHRGALCLPSLRWPASTGQAGGVAQWPYVLRKSHLRRRSVPAGSLTAGVGGGRALLGDRCAGLRPALHPSSAGSSSRRGCGGSAGRRPPPQGDAGGSVLERRCSRQHDGKAGGERPPGSSSVALPRCRRGERRAGRAPPGTARHQSAGRGRVLQRPRRRRTVGSIRSGPCRGYARSWSRGGPRCAAHQLTQRPRESQQSGGLVRVPAVGVVGSHCLEAVRVPFVERLLLDQVAGWCSSSRAGRGDRRSARIGLEHERLHFGADVAGVAAELQDHG